jgi:hypothetical protein
MIQLNVQRGEKSRAIASHRRAIGFENSRSSTMGSANVDAAPMCASRLAARTVPNIWAGAVGKQDKHEDGQQCALREKDLSTECESGKYVVREGTNSNSMLQRSAHIDCGANQVAHGERAAPRVVDRIVHALPAAHAIERRHKVDFRDEVGGSHARLQCEGLQTEEERGRDKIWRDREAERAAREKRRADEFFEPLRTKRKEYTIRTVQRSVWCECATSMQSAAHTDTAARAMHQRPAVSDSGSASEVAADAALAREESRKLAS